MFTFMWSRSGKYHANTIDTLVAVPAGTVTPTVAPPTVPIAFAPDTDPVLANDASNDVMLDATPVDAVTPEDTMAFRVTSPYAGPPAPPFGFWLKVNTEPPEDDHVPATPHVEPEEYTDHGTVAAKVQLPVGDSVHDAQLGLLPQADKHAAAVAAYNLSTIWLSSAGRAQSFTDASGIVNSRDTSAEEAPLFVNIAVNATAGTPEAFMSPGFSVEYAYSVVDTPAPVRSLSVMACHTQGNDTIGERTPETVHVPVWRRDRSHCT